jgi:capsid protein
MARKIRDLERNCWLIGRLKSVYSQYSVGPNGLTVTPASSDEEWNKVMEEAFRDWCESPCRDSALPMGEQHQLIADTTHIDGGVFVSFTNRKPGYRQSLPAIQLIEGHRVATPGNQTYMIGGGAPGNDKSNVIDGVQIDSAGRPVGYWVRDSFSGDDYVYRPIYDPLKPVAGGVMHVYDPDRIGMYREITPYHATLNQTTDLEMLSCLEMDRAKANAEIAYNVKTVDGDLPDAQNLVRKNFRMTTASGKADEPDDEMLKRIQQFRTVLGSRVTATRLNEELQQFANSSPSAQTQWYWKFLIEQICEGVNIPVLLVLPESYQGTTTRAVLDDANIWFHK